MSHSSLNGAFILIFALTCLCSAVAFPVGINLSPIGGNKYEMGGTYSGINWDAYSTYVFVDIFKHCTAMYVRSVSTCNVQYYHTQTLFGIVNAD